MAGLKRTLPMSIVFVIFTSLRFVPFFVREIEEIALMQRLRGASVAPRDLIDPRNWKDLLDCLFIPLLIRAIKTAEEAALSAEARGFDVGRHPLARGASVEDRSIERQGIVPTVATSVDRCHERKNI